MSGGDEEPIEEVVVTGKRMFPEGIQAVLDRLNEGSRHTPMDDSSGENKNFCGNRSMDAPDQIYAEV